MLNSPKVLGILQFMLDSGTTISEFLSHIFEDSDYDNHPAVRDIADNIQAILSSLFNHHALRYPVLQWALTITNSDHANSIQTLTRASQGWHFSASNASAEQLQEFELEDMADSMESDTPHLWRMIKGLLSLPETWHLAKSFLRCIPDLFDSRDSGGWILQHEMGAD
jgi:hypothetical protein